MSGWFSDKHKDIYSKAYNALCEDAVNISSNIYEKTKNVASYSYNYVKRKAETATDIACRSYDNIKANINNNDNNNSSDNNINDNNNNNRDDDSDGSDDNNILDVRNDNSSDNTEDSINELCENNPDIIIHLDDKYKYIRTVSIFTICERKIKGKLRSYPHVNNVIHEWFLYVNSKWIPKAKLYDHFKESLPGAKYLEHINKIWFVYDDVKNQYQPLVLY